MSPLLSNCGCKMAMSLSKRQWQTNGFCIGGPGGSTNIPSGDDFALFARSLKELVAMVEMAMCSQRSWMAMMFTNFLEKNLVRNLRHLGSEDIAYRRKFGS